MEIEQGVRGGIAHDPRIDGGAAQALPPRQGAAASVTSGVRVMNIGQVSALSGLPSKTIRYYEEIGLVSPGRGENGYRRFDSMDAHKLAFVARARSLGFGIEECRQLLELYEDRSRASADVRRVAQDHLDRIDRKIHELEELRRTIASLVEACRGDERPDCPILADLAGL